MTSNISHAESAHFDHPKYRPDIDGLRAIAVLAVVTFHAFPWYGKGGFIGVDIFFVISGYLISTIIIENLERNNFSFVEFYSRRIKRIFPALLLVLTASFAFGWFGLLATEYQQLGKHIAGGAVFISNFLFWHESGYFDAAVETKPLLHLWSLGIEEQFYIFWPLLLWLAWKIKFNLLQIIITVLIFSFAINIFTVNANPIAAFYAPQTRFWELLVGSVLAYRTLHGQSTFPIFKTKINNWFALVFYKKVSIVSDSTLLDIQSLTGAILIITGILFVTKEKHFPGWWAILPTLGAALIISAGMHAWLNRVVLSSSVLVWFGLISFPLYLWHWPLLSFAHIVQNEALGKEARIMLVTASIALAWLTYKMIEIPIRSKKYGRVKTIIAFVLMILAGSIGYSAFKGQWLSTRMRDQLEFLAYFENSLPEWKYFEKTRIISSWRPECGYFDEKKYRAGKLVGTRDSEPIDSLDKSCFERDLQYEKSMLLWGDSHAQALAPGIQKALPSNWQFLQVASSACSPDPDLVSPSLKSQCDQSNYFAIKVIKDAKPDVVVVAQNLGQTAEKFESIADKLKTLGVRRVVLVGPVPHWNNDLPKLLARAAIDSPRRMKNHLVKETFELNTLLSKKLKTSSSVKFANVIDVFCNIDGCLTYLNDDKRTGITTFDYGHLTPIASEFLAEKLLINLIVLNPSAQE